MVYTLAAYASFRVGLIILVVTLVVVPFPDFNVVTIWLGWVTLLGAFGLGIVVRTRRNEVILLNERKATATARRPDRPGTRGTPPTHPGQVER